MCCTFWAQTISIVRKIADFQLWRKFPVRDPVHRLDYKWYFLNQCFCFEPFLCKFALRSPAIRPPYLFTKRPKITVGIWVNSGAVVCISSICRLVIYTPTQQVKHIIRRQWPFLLMNYWFAIMSLCTVLWMHILQHVPQDITIRQVQKHAYRRLDRLFQHWMTECYSLKQSRNSYLYYKVRCVIMW